MFRFGTVVDIWGYHIDIWEIATGIFNIFCHLIHQIIQCFLSHVWQKVSAPPPPKKRKKILFLILKMFKRSLFERNTHNDFILFENSAAFRANEQIYYRSTKYRSGDLRTNLSKIVVKPKLMTQLLTKGDKEEGRGLSWQISVIFWQFEPLSSGRRYRAPIATKAAFRKSFIQSTINIRNLRKVPDEI